MARIPSQRIGDPASLLNEHFPESPVSSDLYHATAVDAFGVLDAMARAPDPFDTI